MAKSLILLYHYTYTTQNQGVMSHETSRSSRAAVPLHLHLAEFSAVLLHTLSTE